MGLFGGLTPTERLWSSEDNPTGNAVTPYWLLPPALAITVICYNPSERLVYLGLVLGAALGVGLLLAEREWGRAGAEGEAEDGEGAAWLIFGLVVIGLAITWLIGSQQVKDLSLALISALISIYMIASLLWPDEPARE